MLLLPLSWYFAGRLLVPKGINTPNNQNICVGMKILIRKTNYTNEKTNNDSKNTSKVRIDQQVLNHHIWAKWVFKMRNQFLFFCSRLLFFVSLISLISSSNCVSSYFDSVATGTLRIDLTNHKHDSFMSNSFDKYIVESYPEKMHHLKGRYFFLIVRHNLVKYYR